MIHRTHHVLRLALVALFASTGAFMKLNATSGARLVGVSTPAAGIAEVHQMKMDGDTMRVREVKGGRHCRRARPSSSSPAATT